MKRNKIIMRNSQVIKIKIQVLEIRLLLNTKKLYIKNYIEIYLIFS